MGLATVALSPSPQGETCAEYRKRLPGQRHEKHEFGASSDRALS